jgi:hypothetical protein
MLFLNFRCKRCNRQRHLLVAADVVALLQQHDPALELITRRLPVDSGRDSCENTPSEKCDGYDEGELPGCASVTTAHGPCRFIGLMASMQSEFSGYRHRFTEPAELTPAGSSGAIQQP